MGPPVERAAEPPSLALPPILMVMLPERLMSRAGAAGWLAGGGGGIPSGFAKMVSEAEDAGTEKITFTNRVMSFKAKDPQLPYNGIATRY